MPCEDHLFRLGASTEAPRREMIGGLGLDRILMSVSVYSPSEIHRTVLRRIGVSFEASAMDS